MPDMFALDGRKLAALAALLLLADPSYGAGRAAAVDVKTIIEKSVAVNDADFRVADRFNYKETDRTEKGTKTYQITTIEGSPYQRLIAVDGKPLPPAQEADEQRKQQQAVSQRRSESASARRERIAKYQKERNRDHEMMAQLTKAFQFQMEGTTKVRGFVAWTLKATPKPGYNPPTLQTQVLKGMQGELWIDQKTFQWVKVTAQVIRPVSIEGFLAKVEPGTQFELENSPVGNGSWQPAHFTMKSHAKVLLLVNHSSNEDDTYFDYKPTSKAPAK